MLKESKQKGHTRPQTGMGTTWEATSTSNPIGLWLCLICFVLMGTSGLWATPQEETRLHQEAKQAIYQKEWHSALNLLGELEHRFPKSTYRTEALYWTAFTMEKLSHGPGQTKVLLAQKKKAITLLNQLIHNFPNSPWCDDAEILRIGIATDLTLLAQTGFKKYVEEAIQSEKKEDIDLKMVALDAMLRLDHQLALKLLTKEYLNINNPGIQENIIFILRRSDENNMIQRLLNPRNHQRNVEISESDCWAYFTSRKLPPHLAARKIFPEYPREAVQECLGGKVTLKILIDRRGRVIEAEAEGRPHPLFKEAAIKAVKQWQYNPFARNGTRESVSCIITFNFFLSLQ